MKRTIESARSPFVSEVARDYLVGATLLGLVGCALIGLNLGANPGSLDNSLLSTIETGARDLIELPYNIGRLCYDAYIAGLKDVQIVQNGFDMNVGIDALFCGFPKIFASDTQTFWQTLSGYLNHGKTLVDVGQESLRTSLPTLVGGVTHGFFGLFGSIITLGNCQSKQVEKTE